MQPPKAKPSTDLSQSPALLSLPLLFKARCNEHHKQSFVLTVTEFQKATPSPAVETRQPQSP